MYAQYLFLALREVWSLLWEIPAPHLPVEEGKIRQKVLIYYMLIMFPLLGCLTWAGLSVLGAVSCLLPGRIAAAMLFAILSTMFLEVLGGGKGLCSWSSFLEKISRKESFSRSLFTAENDIHAERAPIGLLSMFTILLLRGFCLSMLFTNGYGTWFALVFILSYTLQAQLATLPMLSNGDYIIKTNIQGIRALWIAAVVLTMVIGRGHVVATLTALVIAAGFSWTCNAFFAGKVGGTTGALIGAAGYLLEIVLLLVGVGLLVR